jgi:hypothetical protein
VTPLPRKRTNGLDFSPRRWDASINKFLVNSFLNMFSTGDRRPDFARGKPPKCGTPPRIQTPRRLKWLHRDSSRFRPRHPPQPRLILVEILNENRILQIADTACFPSLLKGNRMCSAWGCRTPPSARAFTKLETPFGANPAPSYPVARPTEVILDPRKQNRSRARSRGCETFCRVEASIALMRWPKPPEK